MDPIQGSYEDSYKLPNLHNRVKKENEKTKASVPDLERRISQEERMVERSMTATSMMHHQNNTKVLRSRVDDLNSDVTYNMFLAEAEKFLKRYAELGIAKKTISIVSKNKCSPRDRNSRPDPRHRDDHPNKDKWMTSKDSEFGHLEFVYATHFKLQKMWRKRDLEIVTTPSSHYEEKMYIVEKYITMASRYADLDITRVSNCDYGTPSCVCCWKSLEDSPSSRMGMLVCSNCHTYNSMVASNSNSKDDAPQPATKDDTLDNFESAIKK